MLKMLFSLGLMLSFSQSSLAGLMEREIGGKKLIDIFTAQGISLKALTRTFQFVDQHDKQEFLASDGTDSWSVSLQNKKFMIIIDMTKASSERRLYFMNLEDGSVEKYFVAHGLKSGGNYPTHFSNIPDSNQTSLGVYLTGDSYDGQYGQAVKLYGLEASNDKAYDRSIVMHGASYVSMDFLAENNRMGRSFGCAAMAHAIADKLVPLMAGGAILSIQHDQLINQMLTNPLQQILPGFPEDDAPPLPSEVTPIETLQDNFDL